MIADYIDRYKEVFDTERQYEIVESFVINDHEVAWVEIGDSGRDLMCECDFAENVGWNVDDQGECYTKSVGDKCLFKRTACYMRQQELRNYYENQLPDARVWGGILGDDEIAIVVRDLIARVKLGEFIGSGTISAALFWGGYFYMQTLAAITGKYMGHLWEPIHKMWANQEISLEGAVICDYSKPHPPKWIERTCVEIDGWVGRASTPAHTEMALSWHYEVFRPNGSPAYSLIPGDPLNHSPEFRVHKDDLARAKKRLRRLIRQAQKSKESKQN